MHCPNCRHINPPGSKFCNECGQRLQTVSTPSDRVQSLIPADFAARLETARTEKTMVGERRIVTMLFCDVQGSTAAASRLDPEDWAQIINEAFEYMIRPVYAYEGNVARLMGDGILAFFGAPVTHEDDPQRAILAGLDIVEGFKPYREKIRENWGLELEVRVGINTGLVMVGAVGSDLQMEYTALGDAINIAARMEQTATPGTVQVAEETYQQASPVFDWEALGEVPLKGKEEPLHTYRPLRIRSMPGPVRGVEGLDAPMVGRRTELERLRAFFGRLGGGRGGIVFISGEAGLGKSRLLRELKDGHRHASGEHVVQWHEVASLSYETTQPYSVFQRLLRRVYGVQENDTPAEIWEKFLPILNEIPPDVGDRGRMFEALFAVHGQSSTHQPESETFKRQLFDLMSGLVAGWADAGPRVIVLDDLHWADPASIELLAHLFPVFESRSLLLVCAMRPEKDAPAWLARQNAPAQALEITLQPLTPADTDELVSQLLLTDLPARLRGHILEKTEGNPFFIEEVIRTMIDTGLLRRDGYEGQKHWRIGAGIESLEIPGNLQTLLTARIDRLDEPTRRTLQLAAVIGRSFSYRVLEAMDPDRPSGAPALEHDLANLQQNEMILETTRSPEAEYMFRHALTQEAAYRTILLRKRREYHRLAAETIEALFSARIEDFHPILAQHYDEARDARGFRYAVQAGDAAFRISATLEALNHYARAHRLLGISGAQELSSPQVSHLFRRRGRCLELMAEFEAAAENYSEMHRWGEDTGDESVQLAALIAQATLLATPNPIQDASKALEFAQAAGVLAQKLQDPEAQARINWVLMLIKMYSGEMTASARFGVAAAEIAGELGLTDLRAHALHDLGWVYLSVGEVEKADRALAEARPLWDSLQNLPMLAENYANTVYLRVMRVQFAEALQLSEKAQRISRFIENDWSLANSLSFIGLVHLARGEVDRLIEMIGELLAAADRIGHPGRVLGLYQLTFQYIRLGALDRALETASRGLEVGAEFPPFQPLSQASMARLEARRGNLAEAEAFLRLSTETQQRQTLPLIDLVVDFAQAEIHLAAERLPAAETALETIFEKISSRALAYFLPEAQMLQAEIYRRTDRLKDARHTLQAACKTARESGMDLLSWEIETALGNEEPARHTTERILANITEPGLQSSFQAWIRHKSAW